MACGEDSQDTRGLCSECWREAHFISGLVCDSCGLPLPGETDGDNQYCDICRRTPPSWDRGRAVALYSGPVKRLVLALKHGDRLDVAGPVAQWMAQASQELADPESVVLAVPLHWRRLLRRQYNQSVLIGEKYARVQGLDFLPDSLRRVLVTRVQKGMTREERFQNQLGAVEVPKNRIDSIAGRPVIVIDDVMTTGATLSACAEACRSAGATSVNVVVAARVSLSD